MKQQSSITLLFFFLSAFFVIGSLLPVDAFGQPSRVLTFYVATTGSSRNHVTMASPFLRPEDARDAINKVQGPVNATVYIRGGNYPFTKSFTITQDNDDSTRHITYSNYQNEKVRFTGSAKLDNSKFTLVSDPAILNRLPASARGKVMEINLKNAGITDYGKWQPHGYKIIHPAPLELFYNEIALTVARYPNTGYLPVGTLLDPGTSLRYREKVSRGAKFMCPDNRINNWKTADNAWITGYFSYGYSDDYMKVDTFDFANHTIRLKDPSVYSVFSSDDASKGELKNAQKIRGFYVYNLLEELDEPGEWYLDQSSGKLYVWPPDNTIGSADIEVSLLEDPIVVMSGTWNTSFRGIGFEYSRGMGMYLEGTSNTVISHCNFDDLGTVGISTGNQLKDKPVQYRAKAGGNGSAPSNKNLLIEVSSICNTGTGGVFLDGGDKKTLQPANNVLDNCDIYNYSRINRTFCPAVTMNGVGNRITHCYIHDAPDHAIVFYGNDHVIAFNHIKNVLYYVTDSAPLVTEKHLVSTDNVISNNFFDNIESKIGSSIAAVYLDDGSSGMEVDGNVFYKSGSAGTYHMGAVHVNGGSDNTFRNNYFIDCGQAFSNNQWSDKQWKDLITSDQIAKTYRPGIDIRSDVYAQKYSHIARLMDSNTLATRQNYTFNTLVYKVGVFSTGAGYAHKNVFMATGDPGFADLDKPDFTLTKTPAALQQSGDWKPIPFEEIGIKKK